jgi:hypothetical protein
MSAPEHLSNIFRNGDMITPQSALEMRTWLKANKPFIYMMVSDKMIADYNSSDSEKRKKLGQRVLSYIL